jgi:hypothetical protein
MATYVELLENDFARQIEFLNIKKYHEHGFKGNGITILNAESIGDHREMTSKVIRDFAPEVTLLESLISARTSGDKVLEATVTINGEKLDFEKAIDKYNIKIVSRSYSGSSSSAFLNYLKDIQKRKGVIFFCSAGNEGVEGVTGVYAKDDTAIAVGAARLKENGTVERMYYSAIGEELDFMCFMARGTGTSAASPALAAITVLLLQRYGDFNQEECMEVLKYCCVDLGEPGDDNYFGWGIPVLPLTDKLEILEKLRGEEMPQFKDVEDTRWSKEAIDCLVARGELKGFEDGTFRPSEPLTREQYAQARYNQLKLEGRI